MSFLAQTVLLVIGVKSVCDYAYLAGRSSFCIFNFVNLNTNCTTINSFELPAIYGLIVDGCNQFYLVAGDIPLKDHYIHSIYQMI